MDRWQGWKVTSLLATWVGLVESRELSRLFRPELPPSPRARRWEVKRLADAAQDAAAQQMFGEVSKLNDGASGDVAGLAADLDVGAWVCAGEFRGVPVLAWTGRCRDGHALLRPPADAEPFGDTLPEHVRLGWLAAEHMHRPAAPVVSAVGLDRGVSHRKQIAAAT